MSEWGSDAPRKLATVVARWNRVRNELDDNGKGWLDWFIDHSLQPGEVAAVLDVLAA